MSIDEGYVKYDSNWTRAPAVDSRVTTLLDRWRRSLFDAKLIGYDPDHEVGYGNLSIRYGDGGFVISGTQTGHLANTTGEHYCRVTAYDIDANRVRCEGPCQASSEALTHAALYGLDPRINAVVHVHSEALWSAHRDRLPTTRADVAYGTPAMAREFERLYRDGGLAGERLAVMAGHAQGLVAIGDTLADAAGRILALASA